MLFFFFTFFLRYCNFLDSHFLWQTAGLAWPCCLPKEVKQKEPLVNYAFLRLRAKKWPKNATEWIPVTGAGICLFRSTAAKEANYSAWLAISSSILHCIVHWSLSLQIRTPKGAFVSLVVCYYSKDCASSATQPSVPNETTAFQMQMTFPRKPTTDNSSA